MTGRESRRAGRATSAAIRVRASAPRRSAAAPPRHDSAGATARSRGPLRSPPSAGGKTPPELRSEEFRTREFEWDRWEDFERLFRRYDGVQAGCWCMFYHREGPNGPLASAERAEANRRDHRELLRRDHAHGILVYVGREVVGWCQYGRREDLPRIERGRTYRALGDVLGPPPRWRITCFFVDRPFRHRGVAQLALRGALEAIRRQGGGVVEAYPATHGRAVAMWFGTVPMFRREGFRAVRPFGASHLLMRRDVVPSPSSAPRPKP